MIKYRPSIRATYTGDYMFTLITSFIVAVLLFTEVQYIDVELKILVGFLLLWILLSFKEHLYDAEVSNRLTIIITNYIKVYFILIGLMLVFFTVANVPDQNKNGVIAIVLALPVVGIPFNLILTKIISHLKQKALDKTKYTLVAGVGSTAMHFENQLYKQHRNGHHIKGFVKCKNEECAVENEKVVSDLDNIHHYLSNNTVDEIVIALPVKTSKKIKNIIDVADYHGVRVKYIPDFQGLFGQNYKITKYGQLEAINVRQTPLDDTYALLLKNTFDKAFSFFVLVLLSPLYLFIAALIKLDSPGPVFYCPVRIGQSGKPFKVFKFRSMRVNDSQSGGEMSTQKDDDRISRVGRVLRKYSLDELPQFLNVLLGDMSVVGPRPHRSFLNQQFQMSVDKYMVRHYFKPGITGWAQVNGWRGPTTTPEQKNMRTKYDLWYVENWSLLLDLRIVYLTVFSKKTHSGVF